MNLFAILTKKDKGKMLVNILLKCFVFTLKASFLNKWSLKARPNRYGSLR